jgi:CheY-like chemotaxis protein
MMAMPQMGGIPAIKEIKHDNVLKKWAITDTKAAFMTR